LLVGFGAVLLSPVTTLAADLAPGCDDPAISDSSACKDINEDQTPEDNELYGPNGVLTKAAGIIAWIGGVAAVIMIILGGFTFITGSSDPNTLSAAKKTVLYAVVGLIVMVLPSAIIRFVLSKL
jgi:hypothetical protein